MEMPIELCMIISDYAKPRFRKYRYMEELQEVLVRFKKCVVCEAECYGDHEYYLEEYVLCRPCLEVQLRAFG